MIERLYVYSRQLFKTNGLQLVQRFVLVMWFTDTCIAASH